MNTFLENQNWRYATKKFDNTKKISNENLDFLKEAIRLSSSSYGLQLYKVVFIDGVFSSFLSSNANVLATHKPMQRDVAGNSFIC